MCHFIINSLWYSNTHKRLNYTIPVHNMYFWLFTCSELRTAKRYWKIIVSLFTAKRPKIQVSPNSGSRKMALFTPDLYNYKKKNFLIQLSAFTKFYWGTNLFKIQISTIAKRGLCAIVEFCIFIRSVYAHIVLHVRNVWLLIFVNIICNVWIDYITFFDIIFFTTLKEIIKTF